MTLARMPRLNYPDLQADKRYHNENINLPAIKAVTARLITASNRIKSTSDFSRLNLTSNRVSLFIGRLRAIATVMFPILMVKASRYNCLAAITQQRTLATVEFDNTKLSATSLSIPGFRAVC